MANRYVYSGAAGGGTGADWANAFTSLTAACAADAAGDVFFVAHDHAESTAGAVTLNFAGTTGTPSIVYCVNRAGSVPPVAADLRTTGTVTTTTTTSVITINGALYCYGLTFTTGSGAASGGGYVVTNDAQGYQVYQSCGFVWGSTGAGNLQVGSTTNNTFLDMKDCTITFANTGSGFSIFGPMELHNCTLGGSAIPTNLFAINVQTSRIFIESCNLSAFGSGKSLMSASTLNRLIAVFKDCRLGASVTIAPAGSSLAGGVVVDVINCDSADTGYRTERHTRFGVQSIETTIIRTGGSKLPNNGSGYSWKIITSAEAEPFFPFECRQIGIWNETTGSAVTATIEGTWGTGSVPTNAQIWVEAQYLGTSGFPLALRATNGKTTPLHTATNQAASSAVWGGGTTDFAMAVTFTPQEKGLIYLTVKAAAASTTFYVDPKVTLS